MGIGNYQENAFGSRLYTQGLFEESSVAKHRLGTIRLLDDGRKYVYCLNGAAQLAAGTLASTAHAPVDATVAAADAALGIAKAKEVSVTVAAVTLNQFQDGWLVIKAGAGIGEMYKIKGNRATGDPATGRVGITLYDAISTAWTAANTTVALLANPYKTLIVNPAVPTGGAQTTEEKAMVLTTRIVTANYYFWGQIKGLASALLDVDGAAGAESNEKGLYSGTTAGSMAVEDVPVAGVRQIGHIIENGDLTDAEATLIYLNLEA